MVRVTYTTSSTPLRALGVVAMAALVACVDERATREDARVPGGEPGDGTTSDGVAGSDTAGDETAGPRLDVAGGTDGGGHGCDCGEATELSYIWVANSGRSEVSKIDTRTAEEVGRYLTRADANGNPSRTSVSLSGNAVAVANRHGGLIKIWADPARCEDRNGIPGIQTSTGKEDVLAWGEDECVAWYRELPGWTVQRPVAWAPGDLNDQSCSFVREVVWTAGCGGGAEPGQGQEPSTHVVLLDGDTGATIEAVELDGFACEGAGPYGGAVDGNGNFWVIQLTGDLARVDRETFAWERFASPDDVGPYGLTVDREGRPWVTSANQLFAAVRFDPPTRTWERAYGPTKFGNTGIGQGGDGRMWIAGEFDGVQGVTSIDPDTLEVLDTIAADSFGKGVSVDADGYVWRAGGQTATRIDPDTGAFTVYDGLQGAYTYSDMTGFAVANASGCPPVG